MNRSSIARPQPNRTKSENWRSAGLALLVMLTIAALVFAAVHYKRQRWDAFAQDHDCQVVGKMNGDVAPTVGVSPQGTPVVGVAIELDKTGWKCNDGMTYWR